MTTRAAPRARHGAPSTRPFTSRPYIESGVSWNFDHYPYRGSATLEIDNVTDAKVFDNFGVQRPGRAFYLKLTGEL